jgi:PBP1b-binding outer membrane lipoprotein LpoB
LYFKELILPSVYFILIHFDKINSKIQSPKVQILRKRKTEVEPIVGKMPETIAIFTKKWVNKIPATQ